MSLREALRSGVAAACIVGVATPALAVAPAPQKVAALQAALDVRVAQAKDFSRLEFHWKGHAARATATRDGDQLTISFDRNADPDMARLHTAPPKWIKTAEARHAGGRLQLVLTLAENTDYTMGTDQGAAFVNVFEKPPEPAKPAEASAQAEPEPQRPDPVPPGGTVHMDAKAATGQVKLSFTWANPAGAAVFRRGDALWIVFDASANLDVSSAPKGLHQLGAVTTYRGTDYSAVKIETSAATPVFASSIGNTWTVALGPGPQAQPTLVRLTRDPAGGPAALKAPVAGSTRVIRLPDPEVGDILTVVTALGPAKGVPTKREYVDLELLPSIQGLVIRPNVEDLTVAREGEVVRISRPEGLELSAAWATRDREPTQMGAPRPAAMPALIDYVNWPKTGEGGFLRRYESLLSAATAEGANHQREAPVQARMALARFLVGSELSFEAIGVLNNLAREHSEMLDDPEFRGLRGVARVLARRYAEADADFSSPALADDPSTALWRSYINSQLAHWADARTQFNRGAQAYGLFSPTWRARFATADAKAALAQGDIAGAESRINLALQEHVAPVEQLASRLVQARVIELQGHKDRALKIYTAITRASADSLTAPALLRATQIKLELGQITPTQAATVYDGLRYRWRGDATELETIRALGQLYLNQGRYREALETFRTAGVRLPDLPEAIQLQADLNAAFRGLFLDGLADGLEPVQALGLFYDFKELIPVGADGDLMVRKLAKRLIDVDLLPQAAEFLKWQVDNRLNGVPKAQVATDLATIYLMDRKPEQALEAINASRTTVLPTALNVERRLLTARAWTGLGKYDNALEIIERDKSKDAQELRAEIVWKQKNWQAAGPIFEKALGDRWKNPQQLSSEEEGKLLRAGVAYSLAGDETALDRLAKQYSPFYAKANNPEALRIALSGLPEGRLSAADFSRVSADNEAFEGWVAKMKGRFKTKPAPVGTGKPPATPVKQAQAAGPAKG